MGRECECGREWEGKKGRRHASTSAGRSAAHLPIVEAQDWVGDVFVRAEPHLQRGVHLVPVREHVEHDQAGEREDEVRVQAAEDDAEACGRRSVRDHVEHCAEA